MDGDTRRTRRACLQETAACPVGAVLSSPDLLSAVFRHIPDDDLLCWSLTCRCMRACQVASGRELRTPLAALCRTVPLARWGATAVGRAPLPAASPLHYEHCCLGWALVGAAQRGALAVLEWVAGEEDLAPPSTSKGHGLLGGLRRRHPFYDAVGAASGGGHTACLEWLLAHWGGGRLQLRLGLLCEVRETLQWAATRAAAGGHTAALRALKGACERAGWGGRTPWSRHATEASAGGGHTDTLRYLRQEGCEADEMTCAIAARHGHLETLRAALELGCPFDTWTCSKAARGGHLEVLQYARRHGCEWDEWTCHNAARGGHMAVLQWARSEGCEWNGWTCHTAALGRHLGVLQWAVANGCVMDEWTPLGAAKAGSLPCLQWAVEHGCPWDEKVCRNAARHGHMDVLVYAHSRGLGLSQAVCQEAARRQDRAMLRWAMEQGAPWWEAAMSLPAWCFLSEGGLHILRAAHDLDLLKDHHATLILERSLDRSNGGGDLPLHLGRPPIMHLSLDTGDQDVVLKLLSWLLMAGSFSEGALWATVKENASLAQWVRLTEGYRSEGAANRAAFEASGLLEPRP